jgi:L-iditol 2-dehydrogenase
MPTDRCVFLLGKESIEIRDVPRVAPGPGELVVAIDTATICGTDVKVYRRGGHPTMLTPPCPFGHELAGTIVSVGPGRSRWKEGDEVVVANSASCGACPACLAERENLCADLRYLNGAFAERLLVPAAFADCSVHRKPAGLSFVLAALAEPLACVVHGLDRMPLAPGSRVLVLGAGPIGLMFAYLLVLAGHVATVADPNADRLAEATALGADVVLVEERATPLGVPRRWEAAVDATGTPEGWRAAIDAVRPGGAVNLFGGCAPGSEVVVDTHRVHYEELTILGSYHHRPAAFSRALSILTDVGQPLGRLVSDERPLEETEQALHAMIRRQALKVAIRPGPATD